MQRTESDVGAHGGPGQGKGTQGLAKALKMVDAANKSSLSSRQYIAQNNHSKWA
jgi:hypothetical protein